LGALSKESENVQDQGHAGYGFWAAIPCPRNGVRVSELRQPQPGVLRPRWAWGSRRTVDPARVGWPGLWGKLYGINITRWGIAPYASFVFTSHDCTTGRYINSDYTVTQPPYSVSDGVNLWTTESHELITVELHSYSWYSQNYDTGVITQGCNEYPDPRYGDYHWIGDVSEPVLLDEHINRFVMPFSVR
jgi:hypothetical protein